jgi:RNA polymerase sigma-70 factor (ECF subfamily)
MARVRQLRSASSARTDEADLAALCAEHGPALLAYVTRLLGDRQRAEDVVQETLLRAWTHPDAISGEGGSARAWLFTVARNLTTDQFRMRGARPQEVSDYLIDLSNLATDEDLDLALQSMVVAEALTTLTPAHRAVLVQTFYLGRSVAQAAAELGIPEGTVKSRVFYALRSLRTALVERGVTS